jgi:hypothetical protein
MQNRAPQILDDLIAQRPINHSTVAVQELMHTVGVLDPSDSRTAKVINVIGKQIRAMPPHRVFAPDARVLGQRCFCREHFVVSRLMERSASSARSRAASCSFKPQD